MDRPQDSGQVDRKPASVGARPLRRLGAQGKPVLGFGALPSGSGLVQLWEA